VLGREEFAIQFKASTASLTSPTLARRMRAVRAERRDGDPPEARDKLECSKDM
jgi:hypothetical protein